VGSEKALYNTIGNTTEFIKPIFDPSKLIKDYDTNSSNWNRIHPILEARSGQSWVESITNLSILSVSKSEKHFQRRKLKLKKRKN
jgi:hypothetical protein